jgi:hypothetical protein
MATPYPQKELEMLELMHDALAPTFMNRPAPPPDIRHTPTGPVLALRHDGWMYQVALVALEPPA